MSKQEKKNNYYEVLEVSFDATRKEIVEAYQKIKGIYSKDSMALYTLYSNEESTSMLNLVEEAYQTLINPQNREAYDRENNFVGSKAIVKLSYDRPGSMKRSFIETPNFEQNFNSGDQDKSFVGNRQNSEVLVKSSSEMKEPEYKIDEVFENEYKNTKVFSGKLLKKIREYKNMSLNYVSHRTKISLYHLQCIENEDFSNLPARVYVRGFVQNYARVLSIDVNTVLKSYMEKYDQL